MRISRKEAFSFGLARKLLAHYEGTPLHLDMRSVLDKIAESLEGDITIEPDWLSEHVGVMPEDCVRIDPEVWAQIAGFIEQREEIRATYQTFDGRSPGNEHPATGRVRPRTVPGPLKRSIGNRPCQPIMSHPLPDPPPSLSPAPFRGCSRVS